MDMDKEVDTFFNHSHMQKEIAMKNEGTWIDEIEIAITVADENGKILEMNRASAKNFAKDGGSKLIGSNLFDCHPGVSAERLETLYKEKKPNHYVVVKNEAKKMVHQVPYFSSGNFAGFVELSLPIPDQIDEFERAP